MGYSGNLIGLDIGQSHISAARLAGDADGTVHPLQIAEVGLPRGVFDEKGNVLREDLIIEGLRHLKNIEGLKGKKVVLAVPGSMLSIQPVVRPNSLWGEELSSSVKLELEPGLPYDRDLAHIATKEISRDTSEGGVTRILTVAVDQTFPQGMIGIVKKGGFQVVEALPAPLTLPRAIAHGPGTEVLLSIGMLSSSVMSVASGIVHYAQTIPLGSDHFTRALTASGFEPDEAERWKKTHSLVAPEGKSDPHPEQRAALRDAADSLVEAVYQVMTYDASEGTSSGINRLVLSGGGSMLHGLHGYLSSALGLPVEAAEPHPMLHGIDQKKFPRLALALALAMTDDNDLKKDSS